MITRAYIKRCKDSIGGVKNVYLFGWIKYSRSNITIINNELRAFPTNTLYKMDGLKVSGFSEAMELSSHGNAYRQTLNMTFSKIDDYYNFQPIIECFNRALVEDNNGNYWLLGAYNGLEVNNFNKATGANKKELNGYTVSLTGLERFEAPYVSDTTLIEPTNTTPILASGDILYSSSILTSHIELSF